MKKILSTALVVALTLGIASCNSKGEKSTPLCDSASEAMGEAIATNIAPQIKQDSTANVDEFLKGLQVIMEADTSNHSYMNGMQFGMQLMQQMAMVKMQGGFDVNKEKFLKGFEKALRESKELTPEQQQALSEKVQGLMERASAEAKANDPVAIENKKAGEAFLAKKAKEGYKKTKSGLMYKVLAPGAGENFTEKDIIMTKYEGKHIDGSVFDNGQGQPAPFSCGQVIPGVSEMLKMMKPGMKVEVIIPSELGYGENGSQGVIKPNEVLVFTLETIEVKKADAPDGRQVPVEAVAQ